MSAIRWWVAQLAAEKAQKEAQQKADPSAQTQQQDAKPKEDVRVVDDSSSTSSSEFWSTNPGRTYTDEYESFFGIYAQARDAGILDEFLELSQTTHEDYLPKRKYLKNPKFYKRPKMKDVSTQTKKRKTSKSSRKEDKFKALIKSEVPAQNNRPNVGPFMPLPIEDGIPERLSVVEDLKSLSLDEPKGSKAAEPLFAFPPGYYALAGAAAALSAGLGAVIWTLPQLLKQKKEKGEKKWKRSGSHARDWIRTTE